MRYLSVVGVLIVVILAGCSSISIIPKPATAGAVINPSDQSIKINNANLIVSARVQDIAVGGYDVDSAIGSFYLTIVNNSSRTVSLSLDNFKLVDSTGEKLSPLQPEEVNALLNPDIGYFLPYPYVGYYDVIDLEQHRASTAMASEQPYVGSGLPAVDELTPLTTGNLKPGSRVSGMLYFNIEIIDETRIELLADISGGAQGKNLFYSFPFSIEK